MLFWYSVEIIKIAIFVANCKGQGKKDIRVWFFSVPVHERLQHAGGPAWFQLCEIFTYFQLTRQSNYCKAATRQTCCKNIFCQERKVLEFPGAPGTCWIKAAARTDLTWQPPSGCAGRAVRHSSRCPLLYHCLRLCWQDWETGTGYLLLSPDIRLVNNIFR